MAGRNRNEEGNNAEQCRQAKGKGHKGRKGNKEAHAHRTGLHQHSSLVMGAQAAGFQQLQLQPARCCCCCRAGGVWPRPSQGFIASFILRCAVLRHAVLRRAVLRHAVRRRAVPCYAMCFFTVITMRCTILSHSPVTANAPPTTAHTRTSRRSRPGRDSRSSTMMGLESLRANEVG